MPYIKRKLRKPLNELLSPLITHLKKLPIEEQDGALNYSITKILINLYPKKYFHLNRSLGVLSAVQKEWYRRHIAPYEDQKIQENGDVEIN